MIAGQIPDDAFRGQKFMLLGHSHTTVLANCYTADPGCLKGAALTMPPYMPHDPGYMAHIIDHGRGRHLILVTRGNEANKIAVRTAEDPFDVFVDGCPPPDGSITLVPQTRLRALLQPQVDEMIVMLRLMLAVQAASVTLVETPPPLPYGPAIAAMARRLPGAPEASRMAPDGTRLRIATLARSMRRKFATGLGVPIVEVPPESVDENGMFRKDYCDETGTHGNARYGDLLWQRIVASIHARCRAAA